MSIFKNIILISCCLFFTNQLSFASEKNLTSNEEKQETKIIIKKASNFKKTTINHADINTYKKAINISVSGNETEKELLDIAEKKCRQFGLKRRQNYFTLLYEAKTHKQLMTVLCSDFSGPVIRETQKEPAFQKPKK